MDPATSAVMARLVQVGDDVWINPKCVEAITIPEGDQPPYRTFIFTIGASTPYYSNWDRSEILRILEKE